MFTMSVQYSIDRYSGFTDECTIQKSQTSTAEDSLFLSNDSSLLVKISHVLLKSSLNEYL